MIYFFWGTIVLLILTAIFYIVFFSLVYYWHEKKTTLVVVPLIFTFEFFITGFLAVSLVSIALQYAPDIIKALTSSSTLWQ